MAAVEGTDKRVFHGLDGLRGVAAVFVAMRHTAFFRTLGIHGGFLAVDLFFVLSGFVIAHAYERRLEQGMTVRRFMVLRYLRLWPVYVLGAILGLIAAACHALPRHDAVSLDQLWRTVPYALAMVPGPHIKAMLYPVNSVAWSLALELMINFLYALAWRPLRKPWVLAALLAVSGVALIGSTLWYGKLDVGFQWVDVWGGLPRVFFSFSAGLALYRAFRRWSWRSPVWTWLPMLLLPPVFYFNWGEIVWPLACVLVVFPAIVGVTAGTEPRGWTRGVFGRLGATSYPLYALHKPAGELMNHALHIWQPHTRWGAGFGAAYLAVGMLVCAGIDYLYDRPLRRILIRLVDWAARRAPRRLGLGWRPGAAGRSRGAQAETT